MGIAVAVDPRASNYPVEDGTLAVANMLLAAHSLGLGGCWLAPLANEEKLKEVLGIPRENKLISVISIGCPAESPSPKNRRELKDITFTNRYGSK